MWNSEDKIQFCTLACVFCVPGCLPARTVTSLPAALLLVHSAPAILASVLTLTMPSKLPPQDFCTNYSPVEAHPPSIH